jgi:putative tryptophan/tyrosine transport system substrate-binding protein
MAYDPVEVGVVASLNRPSGNLTGVTTFGSELAAKRLEMLHKLVPASDLIAYLNRMPATYGAETERLLTAAGVLGVRLLTLFGATESEIAADFATIVEQRAGALLIAPGVPPAAIDQVRSLARRYAVPTLFSTRDNPVVSGGLASYGTPASELLRQAGIYTGRILKGEKPADLPVVRSPPS